MVTTRRAVTTAALIACLVAAPLGGTAAASEPAPPTPSPNDSSFLVASRAATAARSRFLFSDENLAQALVDSDVRGADAPAAEYGQWGWHGGGHHHHGHNGASQAAIIFGSIATIAGTGLLIYSNRPECDHFHSNECYGEKVFGGSLLAGGIVSLVVGMTTWH